MSNSVVASKRITIVILLVLACAILALLGWYPTNYEQLFSPLNKFIDYFAYFSLALVVYLFIPNKKIPGKKTISDVSFVHMTLTLGIACAFFSWCADPSGIVATGTDHNPYSIIGFWYGPWEWIMFVPFILIEVYDSIHGLPKWLATIRRYFMAVSMMLGIAISLMAGCTTIPKIMKVLWGVEISPFLVMMPIAALIGISLIRGIHKGMKLFSNITMGIMYFITAFLLFIAIGPKFLPHCVEVLGQLWGNMFTWMHFDGSELAVKQTYPYWLWGMTWAGIIPPFIRKIAEGRSWRSTLLLFILGPSVICQMYATISSAAFNTTSGNGVEFFGHYPVMAVLYIIMLLMMFVTSADSTCYSLDELVSKGTKAPIAYRKLLWIVVMSAFVSILLIAGGGTTDAVYGLSYITGPILIVITLIALGYYIKNKINKEI